MILPAEEREMRAYLDECYRTGTRLNLNQPVEAILGKTRPSVVCTSISLC